MKTTMEKHDSKLHEEVIERTNWIEIGNGGECVCTHTEYSSSFYPGTFKSNNRKFYNKIGPLWRETDTT